MPIIEDFKLVDYPYHGAFYDSIVDESKPLNEQTAEEVLVDEFDCDIQKTSKLHNNNMLGANYNVYFPLKKNPNATGTIDYYEDIKVRRGMTFKGMFYGYLLVGEVEIVRPSQLGGCSCEIKVVSEHSDRGDDSVGSTDTDSTDTDNTGDTDTGDSGGEDGDLDGDGFPD